MRACFIIDPVAGLKPYKDTSLDLMRVAIERGLEVDFCEAHDVLFADGATWANARPVPADAAARWEADAAGPGGKAVMAELAAIAPRRVDGRDYDFVFIRKDPPFDQSYVSLCLQLDNLAGPTFVNAPRGVLAISEKLSTLRFAAHAPRTLVTFDPAAVRAFAAEEGRVVLKAAYYGQGTGVFARAHDAEDFDEVVAQVLALEPRGPVIAQAFLPEVVNGDTRVMMLDGEPVGAVGRMPAPGEFRANIAAGGHEFATELTADQARVAGEVGGFLRDNGIIFAGIDFIGSKLIEINVTSPTLVRELRKVGGVDVSTLLWDRLLAGR